MPYQFSKNAFLIYSIQTFFTIKCTGVKIHVDYLQLMKTICKE